MLTFLRKIRKSLIETGSARKPASPIGRYLLYAIGEIALVVIGILIALQINNWNEGKKSLEVKKIYIENLLEDLALDTANINKLIDFCDAGHSRIRGYFNFFNANSSTLSSSALLDSAMQAEHCCRRYFPINNTFQEIQGSGHLKMFSKELRDALIGLENQQEFSQIRNDRMISNWLSRWEEFKNFYPASEQERSYFKNQQVYTQQNAKLALFHFHHVLGSNDDVLESTKNGAWNVKDHILGIIQLLHNE